MILIIVLLYCCLLLLDAHSLLHNCKNGVNGKIMGAHWSGTNIKGSVSSITYTFPKEYELGDLEV